MKEKKRYLAFEIVSDSQIKDIKAISKQIMDKTLELIGQLGVAKAGVQVLSECWDAEKQKGIIKVNNKHVDELKAALTLVKSINGKEVIVKSIGVSGIMKKAEKNYLS